MNLDFADVRTIMANAGSSLMGIGVAAGENRAAEAAKGAISSPLLESTVSGATGVLMNITGGPEMGLFEVNEAATIIRQAAHNDCNVIFGAVIDENVGDHIRVTVIATGFEGQGNQANLGRSVGREQQGAGQQGAWRREPLFPSFEAGGSGSGQVPTFGREERSSLQIGEDDGLDVPEFLK